MADSRSERVAQWREHVDELCHDGETIEHRADLAGATVVVTNQRVFAFPAGSSGPTVRHVDRPNVGTITIETEHRLRDLCLGFVAAFIGIGLVQLTTDVSFATLIPGIDLDWRDSAPGATQLASAVESALEFLETALTVVEWGVLLSGIAAFVVALALVVRYVRSRSRRLVCRVHGGDDLAFAVSDADLEADAVAALERAIRPGDGAALEEVDGDERDSRNNDDGRDRAVGDDPAASD
ncbi:hypothetical protein [Natrinema versiforme]|uniref:Uncharacterized protein n=1 Tax=Natrinema versiforme JCM 10478 TaxID=1227496 RepID=L9XVG4_9EURY|nr:hypothetical protein [Natrinema versiforme]ELY65829.1 hypothetical protein C489_13885 [Natrinema versiforme JCM 10478]